MSFLELINFYSYNILINNIKIFKKLKLIERKKQKKK